MEQKKNIQILESHLKKIHEQYQDKEHISFEGLLEVFTEPLEDLDIEIVGITLIWDEEKLVAYWNIILCGQDSHQYAEGLQEISPDLHIFIHDLHGTRNGQELYNITIIV